MLADAWFTQVVPWAYTMAESSHAEAPGTDSSQIPQVEDVSQARRHRWQPSSLRKSNFVILSRIIPAAFVVLLFACRSDQPAPVAGLLPPNDPSATASPTEPPTATPTATPTAMAPPAPLPTRTPATLPISRATAPAAPGSSPTLTAAPRSSPQAASPQTPSPTATRFPLAPSSATATPLPTPRPSGLYLALGDSLAAGTGATQPDQSGYVALLHRHFRDGHGPVRLVNLAVGGETGTSFIAGRQLAAAVAAIADPQTDVEVVTLDIGGNDLLDLLKPGRACRLDPDSPDCQEAIAAALPTVAVTYAAILATLTSALTTDPGPERLLVMTYYNPFGGTGTPHEARVDIALLGSDGRVDCVANVSDPARVGLNDLITCLGSAFGAEVVEVYPLFGNEAWKLTHIAREDIHPNDAGYARIADAFVRAYAGRQAAPTSLEMTGANSAPMLEATRLFQALRWLPASLWPGLHPRTSG